YNGQDWETGAKPLGEIRLQVIQALFGLGIIGIVGWIGDLRPTVPVNLRRAVETVSHWHGSGRHGAKVVSCITKAGKQAAYRRIRLAGSPSPNDQHAAFAAGAARCVNHLPVVIAHQPAKQPAQRRRALSHWDLVCISDADHADPGFDVKNTENATGRLIGGMVSAIMKVAHLSPDGKTFDPAWRR